MEIAALFAADFVEKKAAKDIVSNLTTQAASTSNWRKNRLGMRG
jgi:hypothetical protein